MSASAPEIKAQHATTDWSADTLRHENALLHTMLNALPVGIFALQPVFKDAVKVIDFVVEAANQQALTLVRLSDLSEVKGLSFNNVMPGYREGRLLDRFQQVYQSGETQHFEVPNYAEGGITRFAVEVKRLDKWLLITCRDAVAPIQEQLLQKDRASMLQHVLSTIQACVFISEAIRQDGNIVDFRIIEANGEALAMMGRPANEVIGRLSSELFPYSHATEIFNNYVEVLLTGKVKQYDVPYFEDGISAWFSMRLSPSGSERVISSCLNITDIKEAQLAQQRQMEALQGILENIPSGLFISEAIRNEKGKVVDFRIMEANRVGLAAYGLSREAVVGHMASELFPDDQQNGVLERYIRVIESQEPDFFTFSFTENDIVGWVDVRLTPHNDNWVIASSLDITAIKEAERAQFQQTELLQSVLNSSQHSIVFLEAIRDEEGHIVDFWYAMQNETNARSIGLSNEQIQGRTLLELFPGTGRSGLFDQYVEVAETGISRRLEEYYENGNIKGWFDLSVAKRGDGVVVTIVDITETREFRQKLELANAELRRSNDNLQQFAYVASHDLQEPLRKIQAFGEILVSEYSPMLGDNGSDLIRRMQSAADRMSVLIRDLLTYSRITTHREPFQPVNLNKLLADVVNDLDLLIRDKNALLEIETLPVIEGEMLQLGQLFQNLLSNALKFTRSDVRPHIQISCRVIRRNELPPAVLTSGAQQYYEIKVQDNGVGFDEKYAERIFQVFQRLHGKSQFPGTGIGLAICRKVVENHKGIMVATGQPGVGATFSVYLPA